ncbi:hypothetical protein K493DRAFT_54922 [Basidiobolus meristosporus CBS 931.73]|uniref:Arrestin C-terminal-like domain-containing protein n=1 Tax=Basidiobolus meristosporus CBS 931.73 TaxID=1314790 RepID=A0A1Y1XYU7_9FUNG|nr:hypothetical protein K493DRAFT_54922 [Basidiobolus meristosporus CBS 931.73]|eukprot:ORX90927.1 hypothetical protein K493DRAFT_54922 [Basidiobolus meristosporus CBS 931.73]
MLSTLGSSSLNIELVDHEKTYFPGDAVRGNVVLKMTRSTPTKCIVLQFVGEITTSLMSLTERKFNETQSLTLFNTELVLYGARNSEASPVLTVGEHKFPFEFLLPGTSASFTLPTSYLGNKGSIQYSLRAIHHKPWVPLTLSPRSICPVLVSDLIDTQDSIYLSPFDQIKEASITLGTFRKSKGVVECKVFIPKRAFAKGETFPVKISVNHIQPIRDVAGIHLKLYQLSKFAANGYEQKQVTAVFVQELPLNIDATSLSCHVETKVRVPRSLPPTTITAPLISFSYELHVKIDLVPSTFYKKRLEFVFPLIIGTYPIIGMTPEDSESIVDTDPHSTPTEEEGDWTVVLPHLAENQAIYDITNEASRSLEHSSPVRNGPPRISSRSSSLDNTVNANNHSRSSSFHSMRSPSTSNPEPSAPHIRLIEKPPVENLEEVSSGPSTSTAQGVSPSAPSAFDLGYMIEESEASSSHPTVEELPPSYQEALRDGASQQWK